MSKSKRLIWLIKLSIIRSTVGLSAMIAPNWNIVSISTKFRLNFLPSHPKGTRRAPRREPSHWTVSCGASEILRWTRTRWRGWLSICVGAPSSLPRLPHTYKKVLLLTGYITASVCGVILIRIWRWSDLRTPKRTLVKGASQPVNAVEGWRRRINNFSFCYCCPNHMGSSPNLHLHSWPRSEFNIFVIVEITKN